jgi:hypothetical protein
VKNITLSVPAAVYRRARMKAAERDTSVSALVRDFLIRLADDEDDVDRRRQLERDVLASIKRFGAAGRLGRDEAHARRAVR